MWTTVVFIPLSKMVLSLRIFSVTLLIVILVNYAFCCDETREEFCELPFADDPDFMFPDNSIFFVETSSRGGLSLRQACSVESAAKAHPHRPINVLFTEPTRCEYLKNKRHTAISKYNNINLYRINISEFSRNTPLHKVLTSPRLNGSRYVLHHKSDMLRYLILLKFGGIYSDLDVIMLKSLDTLPQTENWVSRENNEALAAGLMSISKNALGQQVIIRIIWYLAIMYKPDNFAHHSIEVLRYALSDLCGTSDIKAMCAAKCQGFEVYESRYFYMLPPELADLYFAPGYKPLPNFSFDAIKVYAFHVWNYITRSRAIHPTSLYAKLMKTYCPIVHNLNKDIKKITLVQRTKPDAIVFDGFSDRF